MTQLNILRTKGNILRAIALVGAALVLAGSVGVVGASNYGGGFGGHGKKGGSGNSVSVKNNNNVGVTNTNDQNATSGDAEVNAGDKDKCGPKPQNFRGGHHGDGCKDDENTQPANATTGAASNENTTNLSVEITNDGLCDCLDLGGESDGRHGSSSSVRIENNNSVSVVNVSTQNATSGDATVNGGGDATTGDASNSNDTTISVSVSN